MDLIVPRPEGLYCPPGDFFIDPQQPVDHAVVTHAHGDHASAGHRHCLVTTGTAHVLRVRLGADAFGALEAIGYGETVTRNGVHISLHPSGHVLGAAQVRIEYRGEVWAVSGDYKLHADPTCTPFEPVRCDVFITESTFGLPIYRWAPPRDVFAAIDAWWRANADAGRASVLYAYAFGKAQRILAGVDAEIGPIVCHGAVTTLNAAYAAAGVALPAHAYAGDLDARADFSRALVIAPPSAQATPWLRRFGRHSDGFASGWMLLRGARRRRAVDRGFVLSDHADWPGLLSAIESSGAPRVIVTHGYTAVLARWLRAQGIAAAALDLAHTGASVAAADDAAAT